MRVYENKNCWIVEDYLDLNLFQEIKLIIQENLDNLYKDKKGYSTTGKNAEQYWLINKEKDFFTDNSRFYEFEKEYKKQILNRIKELDLFDEERKENIDLKNNNAWSVIGEENSYHTFHDHGRGYDGISTLVYLEVPETNKEDEPENNIFLTTHVGPKSPWYYEKPPIVSINPEVAKLLIFPDWIPHGTYPQTKGIRQTFNCNYRIVKKEEKSNKFSYN